MVMMMLVEMLVVMMMLVEMLMLMVMMMFVVQDNWEERKAVSAINLSASSSSLNTRFSFLFSN